MLKSLSWQSKLGIYTFCIFFTSASYTMCIPFLPVYLLELGASHENIEMWSALVFSICFLIAGIMAPIWGKISDTHGKKSMALRSAILLCLSYGCGGFVTAPYQLLLMRVLQGFANGYLPVVLSMVAAMSPREKLGTSLSFIQSSQLVGTVSGPLLGGALAGIFGYRASFIIAGCCLAFVVLITFLTPESESKAERATEKSSIIDDIAYCFKVRKIFEILGVFFVFSMVMLAIQPLLSLFVAKLLGGYDDVALYTGLACSLPPFIGAFVAPIWGLFGQKKGYYKALSFALLGAGICLIPQGMATNYYTLLVMSGLMGLFIVGIVPSLNALITISTPENFKGRAFGVMTMANQFGCMGGPILGAIVTKSFSIETQFFISGLLLVLLSGYAFYRTASLRQAKMEHFATSATESITNEASTSTNAPLENSDSANAQSDASANESTASYVHAQADASAEAKADDPAQTLNVEKKESGKVNKNK